MLRLVNELLARVPFLDVTVTAESLRRWMATVAQNVGEWLLQFLQTAAGSVFAGVTASIIFLYVFVSLLVNREQVRTLIRRLNPLGEEVTDLYLAKMGAMVRGTVKGQFVIALCQGVAGAISIYIAGFHDGFFIFAILLTALSVIPLGGGIVTIPFGIGMILFGNVFGGLFVILFHIFAVTNIDNFLRPILVPREARLDPALMLLAVFSGIALFGFWGIIIGPVLMIVIVTTISVYLAVYKGVPMAEPEDTEKQPATSSLSPQVAKQNRSDARKLSQPLSEELDDALARLIGRMPVDLADLVGQHRVRHPPDAVRIALLGVDLDDLERVAEPSLQRLEALAGRHGVFAEPQAHRAQSLVGGALFDDLQLGFGKPGIAPPRRRQRQR